MLEHIPFGVLLDENATVEMLQQYPVVCLANTGIVSERELALFRDYVTQGGNLLITGQSGQYDALGRPLANTSLSELIGANVVRRLDSADNWIRFPTLQGRRPRSRIAESPGGTSSGAICRPTGPSWSKDRPPCTNPRRPCPLAN